ncbi:hypothetical protein BX661DRAFT_207132 [Kickxella alabastrina]|uniref:uncharacterized protein n=1 Tax=Kickxella alabastrina TaxID=61397 RepID=UPI00221E797E|nr:uncharacterized protein BX661DRAFT_207132 [Kickxella alabastrina]KAI7823126.1 hypothetical protein BX661DRAFT_207132 [Kickxella alabastrina]
MVDVVHDANEDIPAGGTLIPDWEIQWKHDAVLKLSWTPVNRLPEGAAYAILNKRPVEGIPKIFSKGLLIRTSMDTAGVVLMEYCGQSMAADPVLAQANDTGVLHRDISAGNVCIKNGKVYVIDWGCAKVIDWGTTKDAARDTGSTQPNHIDIAKQWRFNATTVGQVEVTKDPFTGRRFSWDSYAQQQPHPGNP